MSYPVFFAIVSGCMLVAFLVGHYCGYRFGWRKYAEYLERYEGPTNP